MKDLIIISGAPGSGKSTVAEILADKLKSPNIDFGKLREFHLDRDWKNTTSAEEALAFENLVFIIKNYLKHGYHNIIVTDLKDARVREIQKLFKNEDYLIVSLIIKDEKELEKRIRVRSDGFKNIELAVKTNEELRARPILANEYKLDNTQNHPDLTAQEILKFI